MKDCIQINKILLLLLLIFCWATPTAIADRYPRNPDIDILHYVFDLTLSDDKDEIVGITTIRLVLKKEGIEKVRLDFVNRSEALKGKGMVIESIYQGDAKLDFAHANDVVWITLSKPGSVNKEIQLTIRYHGIPADGLRIGPTKFGDRSFFNENWPNRARHWLPTVDHPYEKATSEFIVSAPLHYQVISNGLLVEETVLSSSMKRTHWKQSVPVSSWLYVLGVAEFAVQYVDQFEGKSIQTWVYRQDRDAGFYDFALPTKQVLRFFSDYVGPCVYEKMANVETPSVKGGMETSSAIFYGEELVDGKRSTRLRNIVIHELAHQWFGNSVTESSWDDAWLSEGFATYFTMLFIEEAYGSQEMTAQLQSAQKIIYTYFAKDPSYKIIDDRSAETGPVTNAITYQKGAWVLHMLRNLMGDKSFQEGIRNYYSAFMNGNATTADFRKAMERAHDKDLKVFFDQWLYQGGNIVMNGSWKYDTARKKVTLLLQQTQPEEFNFDFSLEVGVLTGGKESPEISVHRITSRQVELTFHAETRPEKVILDPRTILLFSGDIREIQ